MRAFLNCNLTLSVFSSTLKISNGLCDLSENLFISKPKRFTNVTSKIMKIINLVGIGVVLLASWSCSSSKVSLKQTETGPSGVLSKEDQLALNIHDEVNRYRVSEGMPALKFHSGLTRVARSHSRFMRDNAGKFSIEGRLISHYGIDARRMLVDKKYGIEEMAENVIASHDMGQGNDLAAKMVRGWLRSPNHRHNIRSQWANSGMAVEFDSEGRVFVTHLLGSPKSQVLRVGGPSGW